MGQQKITKSNWDDPNLIQNSRSFILKYSSQNIKLGQKWSVHSTMKTVLKLIKKIKLITNPKIESLSRNIQSVKKRFFGEAHQYFSKSEQWKF